MMKKLLYTVPPALLVIALVGLPLQSQGVQSGAFQLEEATIASIHQAIQQGQITCVGLVQAYLARARAYNHTSDRLVTRDGAPIPAAPGTVRAGAPLKFPTETVAISTLLPNFERVRRPADRARPDGADRVRPGRAAAVRNDDRHAEFRPGERARHDQPPRRALGDVQGRSRQGAVGGRAARRLARRVRGVPQAARRARARGRARRAVRPQPRPGGDADVLHPVLLQGSVRHEGHADDRRRPTRATTSTSRRATTRWSRSCGRRAPSSTPRRSTPNTTAFPAIRAARTSRTRSCCRTSGYQRSSWGGNPPTRTTRRAPPRSARAPARARRSAPTS